MTVLRAMNCGLDGVCVLVCAILLVQSATTRVRRDTDRWFRFLLISSLGVLVGDLVNWWFSGTGIPGAYGFMAAGNTLYFVSTGSFLFNIFAYVYTYMDGKRPLPRPMLRVAGGAAAIQVVLALSTPFTGAIFHISRDNLYVRGPLWPLTQVLAALIYLMVLWTYVRTWSLLNRRERTCFSLYFLFLLAGQLIQDVFPDAALLSVMTTITLLLISTFIHTEVDEELHASEQLLEWERGEAIQALQRKQTELSGEVITALSQSVEAKDRYTNGHSRRVAEYAREIVRRMGWSEEEQKRVYYTGLLHDVGKLRVADTIINKTSALDDEEYAQIKLHTMAGYYILKEISSVGEFAIGARWHHERYDGRGYPNGLSGENIPLIARIISVADAYDAMTSNRSYRQVMPQAEVRRRIAQGSGTQFDPSIAAIMLEMIDGDADYRLRQPDGSSERVILAIDDEPMVHKLLAAIFQSRPMYRLRSARSGEEGLSMLRESPADLVLLDMEMPGMHGFDVLTRIREEGWSVPVVFMTGNKDIDIIQRAEQLGVSDYLTKPLTAHVLMESLQNVLLNREPAL